MKKKLFAVVCAVLIVVSLMLPPQQRLSQMLIRIEPVNMVGWI